MYYLCEKYYKPITVQYYIADSVSWVPRLTLLDLTNKLDLQTHSQNRTRSYVGDLLYRDPCRAEECEVLVALTPEVWFSNSETEA